MHNFIRVVFVNAMGKPCIMCGKYYATICVDYSEQQMLKEKEAADQSTEAETPSSPALVFFLKLFYREINVTRLHDPSFAV